MFLKRQQLDHPTLGTWATLFQRPETYLCFLRTEKTFSWYLPGIRKRTKESPPLFPQINCSKNRKAPPRNCRGEKGKVLPRLPRSELTLCWVSGCRQTGNKQGRLERPSGARAAWPLSPQNHPENKQHLLAPMDTHTHPRSINEEARAAQPLTAFMVKVRAPQDPH